MQVVGKEYCGLRHSCLFLIGDLLLCVWSGAVEPLNDTRNFCFI